MKKFMLFILAAMVVLGTYGTASADTPNGKRLYSKYCVKCHGADGTVSKYGKALKPRPARNLRTNRLYIAPSELLTTIKYGLYGREMKGWQSVLTAEEIIDVAAFLRTMTYKPDVKRGKEFYNSRCARCHSRGGSDHKLFNAPSLVMSPLGPSEMAREVRFGRHGSMMKPKKNTFVNTEVADVIEYVMQIKK